MLALGLAAACASGSREAGEEVDAPEVPAAPEAPTGPEVERAFVDLDGSAYEAEIRELVRRGLLSGIDETHFGPERCVLRADWAVIATRALSVSLPADCSLLPFTDVDPADPRCLAVAGFAAAGFMAGYGDATFQPDAPLVRYEALVSSAAGAGLSVASADADAVVAQHLPPTWQEIPHWARYPCAVATRDGLNAFQRPPQVDPFGCTRRDEAAGLLWLFLTRRGAGSG